MLVVWGVTALVVLVVLGSVVFGVAGSSRRLGREAAALQQELEPVLGAAQQTAALAAARRERPANGS